MAFATRARDAEEIVRQAEAFLSAHIGRPAPIARLSAAIGVGPRTLHRAFHEVRGMSPLRYVVRYRLALVRQALSRPETGRTTVTAVATDYGFLELGRFAGTYKAVFGETPSATLRGARGGPSVASSPHTLYSADV